MQGTERCINGSMRKKPNTVEGDFAKTKTKSIDK